MDMTLKRNVYLPDGIFGEMQSMDGLFHVDTIEHSYLVNGNWVPKIPGGAVYVCKRRWSLHFGCELFGLLNVPNCTDLEIHIANVQANVHGCIGVGEAIGKLQGEDAVLKSAVAFQNLMRLQKGVQRFKLTVIDVQGLTLNPT